MQVALTSTTEQQRKVYDAGCPAYCEATLLPFSKRDFDGSDGKSLPLELPSPPSNYRSPIEFAVNLLEFTSDNGYLRCSLFWNLLSKTIVVNDLKSGQTYREHLTKMKQSCPTILTRDGTATEISAYQFLALKVPVLRRNKATNSSTSTDPFSAATKTLVLGNLFKFERFAITFARAFCHWEL